MLSPSCTYYWNEEYQSCRELPSATLPERLLRDRTLYRIMTDYDRERHFIHRLFVHLYYHHHRQAAQR